jgi:hypothetical protein
MGGKQSVLIGSMSGYIQSDMVAFCWEYKSCPRGQFLLLIFGVFVVVIETDRESVEG